MIRERGWMYSLLCGYKHKVAKSDDLDHTSVETMRVMEFCNHFREYQHVDVLPYESLISGIHYELPLEESANMKRPPVPHSSSLYHVHRSGYANRQQNLSNVSNNTRQKLVPINRLQEDSQMME